MHPHMNSLQPLKRFKYLLYSYRIVWKSSKIDTLLTLGVVLLSSVLPLLSVYLMKLTIDAITAGIASPDKMAAFGTVLLYIALIGITTLLTQALTSVNGLLSERLSLKAVDVLSDELHHQSIAVDLEYYENPDYYDTLHRAQQGAIHKPTSAFNNSVQLLQQGLSFIGMMAVLLTFHWSIAIILIAAVIPGVLFRLKFSRRLYQWDRSQTATQRHSFYYHYLLTGDMFAKEIRLFELGPLFIERFHRLRQELRNEKLGISRKRTVADVAAQLVTVLTIYGSFGFMAYRAVHGLITIGDLVMYYQAFQRGLNYFRSLLTNAASLYEDSLYLSNLFEFLELQPHVSSPPIPKPLFSDLPTIEWQNVSFTYPGTQKPVLHDINVTIKPGEHVALVGPNGAGKTTLIKLLCRLYDPTSGHLRFNGIDAREFDLHEFRHHMSVVFQDFVRYHMKVRDNIGFGNVNVPNDDAAIQASARAAGAEALIDHLPDGYDTMLGKMFDQGHELSIGEWQKIALARAFLRPAKIIVLDEPTSALDAKAEFEIFQKFKELALGKTAFLISHRLSTSKLADRILVLVDGRIVEQGSHDDLMQLDGEYARLFRMQSQYYR